MTPTAEIEVIGSRQTATLIAIVDTGFDGDFCLPTRHAVELGLELIGELADGTRKKELLFAGSVRFLGKTRMELTALILKSGRYADRTEHRRQG